jgi:hypothetical protein
MVVHRGRKDDETSKRRAAESTGMKRSSHCPVVDHVSPQISGQADDDVVVKEAIIEDAAKTAMQRMKSSCKFAYIETIEKSPIP